MRYFYRTGEVCVAMYGEPIKLAHDIYRNGTLFRQDGKGLVVTRLMMHSDKSFSWEALDPALANDIYLSERFPEFFAEHAASTDWPIFPVRKVMWALRMKPLPKEFWEGYFG